MKNTQSFKLIFDEKFKGVGHYIGGIDPYEENSTSFSIGAVTKPKKQWGIKKIRGFNRVINIGYIYTVEILK